MFASECWQGGLDQSIHPTLKGAPSKLRLGGRGGVNRVGADAVGLP